MLTDEISLTDQINAWLEEYKSATNEKIKRQLRDLIVMAYLPFVKKISHGLARRSTDPVEDLIQVGSVGLLKAIDQYNKSLGSSFKTYSTYLITGEIRHYLRDKVGMIRAPRELQELSFRINQIIQKLTVDLDRQPSDLEIARELQIPLKRLNEANEIDRRKQMVSLDQVVAGGNESDQPLVDKLIDNKYEEFLLAQEDRIMLVEAIDKLKGNLKEVIRLSFFEDMSQTEIANQLGISQMQVSRRIKKALEELFSIITSQRQLQSRIYEE